MNASMKAVLRNPQSRCFQLRSAFFHSTPFLDKGRRNNSSNSRFSNYNFSSYRRNRFRGNRLNDSSAYVNYLFESWESDSKRDEEPSNKGPSWFRKSNSSNHGSRRNGQGHQNKGRRGFSFCEDIDYDADETVFQSAFGDRFFVWSYVDEGYSNGRGSSRRSKSHKSSWRWGNKNEDEYHYTPKEDTGKSKFASERTALGLSASGPLKLEDVKTAYRASALKWHPDRHQGSSKATAEEKFKHCTSAYQSLCDSFAVN